MSTRSGFTIECDWYRGRKDCTARVYGTDEADARCRAAEMDWIQEGENDYCRGCAQLRAARPKLATLFPDLKLMNVWDACEEAGFIILTKPGHESAERIPWHCGQLANVESFLGGAYLVRCEVCGTAIGDVTGPIPSPGGNAISLMSSEQVDMDTPLRWVVLERGRR